MMHEDLTPGYVDQVEVENMKEYMEEIKEKALDKLTSLERAALYEDFNEFRYLAQLEKALNYCEDI